MDTCTEPGVWSLALLLPSPPLLVPVLLLPSLWPCGQSLARLVYTLGPVDSPVKPGQERRSRPRDLSFHWQASTRMCAAGRVSLSSSKYYTVVLISLLSRAFSLRNAELLEHRGTVLFIYLCESPVPSSVLGPRRSPGTARVTSLE